MPAITPIPPGWGQDRTHKSWDFARSNQFGTFSSKPEFRRLRAIHSAFARVDSDWHQPQSELGAYLFIRCHAAFRTSAGLASAGQAVESYVMDRAVLEYAAYGYYLSSDDELGVAWLKRHDGKAEFQRTRDAFQFWKIQSAVESVDPKVGEALKALYQRTIDFGAHPNERAVTTNLGMARESGRRTMDNVTFHGDGDALDLALRTAAQCGVCALDILGRAFPERFELLGVTAALSVFRNGL